MSMDSTFGVLEIIYKDTDLVVVNKPPRLFVHQTNLDRSQTMTATEILRRQLGEIVYPLHRLDRPTSGLLMFGRNKETVRKLSYAFTHRLVQKTYVAIVRGHLEPQGTIDYALRRKTKTKAKAQQAITQWRRLKEAEIEVAVPPHQTARYSLVLLEPKTGRWHQLRRHCAHLRHPIIGDTSHGDARHNRVFKHQFRIDRLLLHACGLRFPHPSLDDQQLSIHCQWPVEFVQVAVEMKWCLDSVSKLLDEDRGTADHTE